MFAAMIFGPRDVRIVEQPDPQPSQDQILLKVGGVSPCGSDRAKYRTHTGRPRMWGHEVSGIVAETGSNVPRQVKKGLHVALLPVYGCMSCQNCQTGRFVLCDHPKVINGGFAQFMAVPWQIAMPIPQDLEWEVATLLPDVVCVPAAALRRTHVSAGKRVLVFGAGPIGLSATMQGRLMGARVGVVDQSPERLEIVEPHAELTFDSAKDPRLASFAPEVILECTGAPDLLSTSLALVAKDGWVCVIGGGQPFKVDPVRFFVERMAKLTGSWCFFKEDFSCLIQPVLDGRLDLKPLISRVVSFQQLAEALREWDRSPTVMKIIAEP